MQILQAKMQSDHKELTAVKLAYDNLHEQHSQLSANAMQQAKQIQSEEAGTLCTNGNLIVRKK